MAVQLVVTITAAPGKGAELAQVFRELRRRSCKSRAASNSRYFRVC